MKNNYFYLALLILFPLLCGAQCPTGPVTLNSQAAVDNFATLYPGCTVLPTGSDLTITGNNITNLNGLSVLTASNAAIEIRNNPQLVSISGLQITHAGSDFIIRSNALLTNLNGLQNLQSVQGEFTIRTNNKLTDISSLTALTNVGLGVIIRDNPLLTTLNGLQNLSVVGEILEITENDLLTDISALGNITSITGGEEGALVIEGNPKLTTIMGLGNSATVITGDVIIQNNDLLSQCAAQSICNYLADAPEDAVITITLNSTGCNTISEVELQCQLLDMEDSFKDSISLYPNPAHGQLNIYNTKAERMVLNIYNNIGQLVRQANVNYGTTGICLDGLGSGLYIAEVNDGKNRLVVKLIID